MIKRSFAPLPRFIEYRCNACKKIVSVKEQPKKCPVCGESKGFILHMDEIQIRRA